MIFSIFFSYSKNKTELPCTNSRYTQCLKPFSYLLTAVRSDDQLLVGKNKFRFYFRPSKYSISLARVPCWNRWAKLCLTQREIPGVVALYCTQFAWILRSVTVGPQQGAIISQNIRLNAIPLIELRWKRFPGNPVPIIFDVVPFQLCSNPKFTDVSRKFREDFIKLLVGCNHGQVLSPFATCFSSIIPTWFGGKI